MFTIIISVIAFILGIILFFKIWGMCNNIKKIKQAICADDAPGCRNLRDTLQKIVSTKAEAVVESELCEDPSEEDDVDVSTLNFKVGDIVINKKTGRKVKIKEINANGSARCAEDNGIGHFIREIECYLSSLESIDTNN